MTEKDEPKFKNMIRDLCRITLSDLTDPNMRPEIIIARLEQVTALAKLTSQESMPKRRKPTQADLQPNRPEPKFDPVRRALWESEVLGARRLAQQWRLGRKKKRVDNARRADILDVKD